MTYSTFDKAINVTKGDHTVDFKYGPSRQRYYRKDTNSSTDRVTETLYLGSVEKIKSPNGWVEWKRQLGGIIITQKFDTTGTQRDKKRHYLLKDHLGSVDSIVDAAGSVVQQMSFDPWGQRRAAVDWDTISSEELDSLLKNFDNWTVPYTNRGYTGHEMLDEVGIIHMNGRIYDARLGRFLQADPFIDGAGDSQAYNRYSYVRNNPLNATDPSGHFVFALAAGIALAAAEGVTIAMAFSVMFVAGTLDALAAGASLGDALKSGLISGVSAAAFTAIGQYFAGVEAVNNQAWAGFNKAVEKMGLTPVSVGLTTSQTIGKIASHAITGGVISSLAGGKFGHGFAAAGFTQALSGSIGRIESKPLKVVAASMAGVTASAVTGGKFANGAVTAAFSRAFNDDLSHNKNDTFFTTEKEFVRIVEKPYGDWEKYCDFCELGPGKNFKILGTELEVKLSVDFQLVRRKFVQFERFQIIDVEHYRITGLPTGLRIPTKTYVDESLLLISDTKTALRVCIIGVCPGEPRFQW